MPSKKVYWDACTFIGLLNEEPEKIDACRYVWEQAKRGELVILTSFLSFAEVIQAKQEGRDRPLLEENDVQVVQLLNQPWIVPAVVDERIAVAARKILRQHAECRKPTDAIHLSTALIMNADELHTFDRNDLLGLDGMMFRRDGKTLRICKPELPIPIEPPQRTMFDALP